MSMQSAVVGLLALMGSLVGCDRESEKPLKTEPKVELPQGPTPEEIAERERLEAEARKAKEEKLKAAALEEMSDCCLALAKNGFELRNTNYIEGKKACEAAQKDGLLLPFVLPAIASAIDGEDMPEACQVSEAQRKTAEQLEPEQAQRAADDPASQDEGDSEGSSASENSSAAD